MGNVRVNTGSLAATVQATGDLDGDAADRLRHAIVEIIVRERPGRLIVDLDGVTAMDATTIGALQAAGTSAADLNIDLEFRTAASPLADHLDRCGITDRH